MVGEQGYNEDYFKERGPEWKDHIMFIQWIESLNLKPKSSIFDYGCGAGKFVDIAKGNGFIADGYDPFVTKYKGKVLRENHYDLVINIDVMEHLSTEEEVDKTLSEIELMGKEWFIFSICDLEHWERYQDATHKFCRSRHWWNNKLKEYFDVLTTPEQWWFGPQYHLARKKP